LTISKALFTLAIADGDKILHDTKQGRVEGVLESSLPNGIPYASFLGIPYAKPPINTLRFRNPVSLANETWGSEVRDGTKMPHICPQWSLLNSAGLQRIPLRGSEDCLYLNVHVPKSALKESSKRIPVMVYIHGGGFYSGTGNYGGPKYFMDTEEVVLVTMNYRLGVLGWMSTEDDVIPGNMGLKDQAMALEWVKENVEGFRGDPQRVTLFGESAGGMAVMHHLASPWSAGLFHAAIAQSAPVVNAPSSTFSPGESAAFHAATFVEAVGCDATVSDSQRILDCLQSKTTEELLDKSRMFERYIWIPNPWKPLVDGHFATRPFLPAPIKEVFQNGKYHQVPLMVGHNRDEGAMFLPQFLNHPERMQEVDDTFDVLGPVLLLSMDEQSVTDEDSAAANIYLSHYLPDGRANFTAANAEEVARMMGDVRYTGPIHMGVEVLKGTVEKPLYYYMYSFRGQNSLTDLLSHDSSELDLGVCHADELFLLFNTETEADERVANSLQDSSMSKKLVNTWVRFAKSGTVPDPAWESLNGKSELRYAVLNEEPLRMEFPEEFKKRMVFLKEMWQLIDEYRNFEIDKHPAIQKMLEDRDKELADEYEGEEDVESRGDESGGKWNLEVEEQEQGDGGFEDMDDFGDLTHHEEL